ncbi:MAG: 3D domain-containing protein [bacterium]|nr:3D domain-containing protein [Planctomycetaceae bacterium]
MAPAPTNPTLSPPACSMPVCGDGFGGGSRLSGRLKRATSATVRAPRRFAVMDAVALGGAMCIAGLSAVVTKELYSRAGWSGTPLAALEQVDSSIAPQTPGVPTERVSDAATNRVLDELASQGGNFGDDSLTMSPLDADLPLAAEMLWDGEQTSEPGEPEAKPSWPVETRWFNGRPVRPVRTMTMVVTAYSPDERSCPGTADGITASLHHVQTNAHRMVAADTRILPLGSMISVPGYDASRIVPVLDRGGAIKGNRLDVLFPTHEQARAWGVRRLTVTVWDYADGGPRTNWRRIRDAKP